MELSREVCAQAMRSKDPKFDGRFFIGVYSTGIYCRPVCPAPTPKISNVRFFQSAAAAASEGLRPCLRCRPETAPGTIGWDGTSSTVRQALRIISRGFPHELELADLAVRLGIGQRHLRRLFRQHLGTTPFSVWQTQKLHFAKRLIDETSLSMADIAFASGYGSVRSFNNTFKNVYKSSPVVLRKRSRSKPIDRSITLHLPFRPPLNWNALLGFMVQRAMPGVESVQNGIYQRAIVLNGKAGLIKVWLNQKTEKGNRLSLQIIFPEVNQLFKISEKVKQLFDLDAPTLEIDDFLSREQLLRDTIIKNRGIRIPGFWDPFELSIRAIVGQQISVKGATTIAGRIIKAYGKQVLDHGDPDIPDSVFPEAEVLREADYTGLGLTTRRIKTIRDFSNAVATREIDFENNLTPDFFREKIKTIKGIGEWTAQYISMRVLRDPDAFPESDLGLLKAASDTEERITPKALLEMSQRWRPWRAYAGMYLWRKL